MTPGPGRRDAGDASLRPGSLSRRRMLAGTGLVGASLAATALSTTALSEAAAGAATLPAGREASSIPFHGPHQAGITTPEQGQLAFATYDVIAGGRAGLAALLATWTDAARRLTAGLPVAGPSGPLSPPADTGESAGLGPSRLTLTVGFGPTLFDGRFGLGPHRPDALVDLPAFAGDALDPEQSGGDLCVQACADDARVAFHAVHNLTHLALGSATLRSLQLGFGRTAAPGDGGPTPRNLLGFQDGTNNLVPSDAAAMDRFVWADRAGGPAWMAGGTYLVARRIRIHLEAWERSTLRDQEQTIGRRKADGVPLGSSASSASAPVDLAAVRADGQPVIPSDAHIRVAAPASNGGQALLRRGYSFADGIDPATGELDAGLFFICFQRDARRQFIPIQQALADQDALAQYLETTGSALFACPPGIVSGQSWGHGLV